MLFFLYDCPRAQTLGRKEVFMDIIGKWNVTAIMAFNSRTSSLEWRTAAEIMADENAEDYLKESLAYSYIFSEDGKVSVVMPIPADTSKEEIDAAVAEGAIQLCGEDTILMEEKAWKEENGRFFLDTGVKGEVLGEEVSS